MPCARFFTDWVLVSKPEHQSVNIWIEGVVVENLDVQVPRLEVIGGHKRDARREVVGDLSQHFSQLTRFERVMAGVERRQKLAKDQLCGGLARARAKTGTQTLRHTFASSFPSRLCAKLAPMVKWRRRG